MELRKADGAVVLLEFTYAPVAVEGEARAFLDAHAPPYLEKPFDSAGLRAFVSARVVAALR